MGSSQTRNTVGFKSNSNKERAVRPASSKSEHTTTQPIAWACSARHGGPAGVEAVAAAMAEDRGTLEDVIEPYLIQQGYVLRTARGRVLTQMAIDQML